MYICSIISSSITIIISSIITYIYIYIHIYNNCIYIYIYTHTYVYTYADLVHEVRDGGGRGDLPALRMVEWTIGHVIHALGFNKRNR